MQILPPFLLPPFRFSSTRASSYWSQCTHWGTLFWPASQSTVTEVFHMHVSGSQKPLLCATGCQAWGGSGSVISKRQLGSDGEIKKLSSWWPLATQLVVTSHLLSGQLILVICMNTEVHACVHTYVRQPQALLLGSRLPCWDSPWPRSSLLGVNGMARVPRDPSPQPWITKMCPLTQLFFMWVLRLESGPCTRPGLSKAGRRNGVFPSSIKSLLKHKITGSKRVPVLWAPNRCSFWKRLRCGSCMMIAYELC